MAVAIKVENVSKAYVLGQIGTGTLTNDLKRWYAKARGNEDPFLKIGETNDRTTKGKSDVVWSLKDINFEIEQGDAVGIIGRNGAGKSTLLKILSRVTSPTTGRISGNGRVASLLEVGTGFHPELSGKDNIFLNGAILGMRKKEIKKKFDEIVDFAGVERYIDTPVKRYSSGMYVRLAFAVAAHLENEILIVDEVLAVGDAEFQKKCLGKMKNISKGEGKTVLFVSHNMAAIQNLCKETILLKNGKIEDTGSTENVIHRYFVNNQNKKSELNLITERSGNRKLLFTKGRIRKLYSKADNVLETFTNAEIILHFKISENTIINNARIDIGINNSTGERIAWLSTETLRSNLDISKGEIKFTIFDLPLSPGNYTCNIYSEVNYEVADWLIEVMEFSVMEKDYYGAGKKLLNQGSILMNYAIKS